MAQPYGDEITPDQARAEERPEAAFQIHFKGNEALSDSELLASASAELADFERLGLRRAEADDAAFQMELAFRRAGFPAAVVDYEYFSGPEGAAVTFLISEGQRVRIRSIDLSGNSAEPLETLLPFVKGAEPGLLDSTERPYVEAEIRDCIGELRTYYLSQGFLEVKVEGPDLDFSEDRSEVAVGIRIEEGTRYMIRTVHFTGDVLAETEQPLAEVADELVGLPFFKRRKLVLRNHAIEVYGKAGYPDAQVRIEERIGEEPGEVILEAAITAGPLVRIAEVTVSGNDRTNASFIRSRLTIKPGDLFRNEDKQKSFRSLYKTGLFSRVDIALTEGDDPSNRDVDVHVEEAPFRELFLEPGWGSYELLRLKLGYRDKNLWGTGRILRTEAGASVMGRNLLTGITDPWFLHTDITADLPLYYRWRQEPSFTREEIGSSLLFSKEFRRDLTMSCGYQYRMAKISDLNLQMPQEELDSGYTVASTSLQATIDTRDDIFFPTTGHRTFLSGELSDPGLGSEISFYRVTTGARVFFPVTSSIVLGLRYNTGFILPGRNETTIPVSERFFNGGENTVRSFRESELGPVDAAGEPVGGMAFNVVNVELRHRLTANLAGTLFFDYGNLSPNLSPTEEQAPPSSRSELISATFSDYFSEFSGAMGVGLQYLLPIGPIRLDVAMNPHPDEVTNESKYVTHFSVGMAF